MHIVHLSSEIAKIAKAGGLADVVYGLSRELSNQGHLVDVILPKYDTIDYPLLENLHIHKDHLVSYDGPGSYNNTIWKAKLDKITLYFIEPHHPDNWFNRGQIYGFGDDTDRFLYFCRAAMEFLFKENTHIDALHLHDWPVATAALLYKDLYTHLGMHIPSIVLTLHNVEHQGKCSCSQLTRVGVRGDDYLLPDRLQDPSDPRLLNLLKGGIIYCDTLATVSPSYKEEILQEGQGYGLEKTLQKVKDKLHGILNGIDPVFWNPEEDPFLAVRYTSSSLDKESNKKALCSQLGLEGKNSPLVACVSRLVKQKSPELIAQGFMHTLKKGGMAVILGSAHDQKTMDLFLSLKQWSEENYKGQGAIILSYNEALSHLLYAACDIFMIPSLFEPCGLTQMIALRYGSIPIARKTGGLKDTIIDVNEKHGNGFLFEECNEISFLAALDRAFTLWETNPKKWSLLVKQGMMLDYTWKQSTLAYLTLYNQKK